MDPLLEQLLAARRRIAGDLRAGRPEPDELEKSPAKGERFDELARGLHTLKGSAATLGLDELADFAHRMEDVVLPLRGSSKPLPASVADALLKSLDVWMARLRATSSKAEPPDLAPSLALLEKVKPPAAAQPKGKKKNGKSAAAAETLAANLAASRLRSPNRPRPPAPEPVLAAAPSDAQADSWRALAGDRAPARRAPARCGCAWRNGAARSTRRCTSSIAWHSAETAEARAVLLGVRRRSSPTARKRRTSSRRWRTLKAISTMPVDRDRAAAARGPGHLHGHRKASPGSVVGAEVAGPPRSSSSGTAVHPQRGDHGLETPDARGQGAGKGRSPSGWSSRGTCSSSR